MAGGKEKLRKWGGEEHKDAKEEERGRELYSTAEAHEDDGESLDKTYQCGTQLVEHNKMNIHDEKGRSGTAGGGRKTR